MEANLRERPVTHKFLWTRKVEQLHHSEVIARDDVKARVGHAGTGDIRLV